MLQDWLKRCCGKAGLFVLDDQNEHAVIRVRSEQLVAGLAAEGGKVVGGAGVGGAHGKYLPCFQRGQRFFGAKDGQGAFEAGEVEL